MIIESMTRRAHLAAFSGLLATCLASGPPCLTNTAAASTVANMSSVAGMSAQAASASRVATKSSAQSGPIAVSLTGSTPPTLKSGDSLSLSVQVRNTGSTPLTNATARISVAKRALDTLEVQSRWIAGDVAMTNPVTATTKVTTLAPGASTNVTVTIPANQLDVSFSMATMPLQVDVTRGGATATIRSFVTTQADSTTFTPMSTSVVIPITLPADPKLFTASGRERFDAWNKAIGPDSDIQRLLASNPGAPVTWMIDPAVLDPAAAQDGSLPTEAAEDRATTSTPSSSSSASVSPGDTGSAGSTPSSSSASSTASTGSASPSNTAPSGASTSSTSSRDASSSPSSSSSSSSSSQDPAPATTVEALAADLVATLKDRPSGQQVVFTPYGDPDLSSLTADDRPPGSDAVLRRTLARPLSPALKELSTTVVAAPAAPLSVSATNRLSQVWSSVLGGKPLIITPNVTLDGSDFVSASSAARRSTSGIPMIGYTSALSAPLSSDGADSDVEAGLREQAAGLALYQQFPSADRSLMVMGDRLGTTSPSRLAQVLSAIDTAPWMTTSALDVSSSRSAGTVAKLSTEAPASDGVWPRPSTQAFDARDLQRASRTLASLTQVAGAVVDGDDIVPAWSRNLDQLTSTRWRGTSPDVDELVQHASAAVSTIPEHVRVVPARINFFSDSGTISVTVKNDLARDVKDVSLTLTPRTYAVQFRSQPEPVTIKAKGQTTVRVPLAAQAASLVDVDASLTAANGVALGPDTSDTSPLRINARPTGTWIFWVLGIVALLVFCYGLVRGRKAGTRRRDELARDIQLEE